MHLSPEERDRPPRLRQMSFFAGYEDVMHDRWEPMYPMDPDYMRGFMSAIRDLEQVGR